ncbi:hypothetical protein LINGRAHAP2_LOCUS32485, partial [Linum grandiflorum]
GKYRKRKLNTWGCFLTLIRLRPDDLGGSKHLGHPDHAERNVNDEGVLTLGKKVGVLTLWIPGFEPSVKVANRCRFQHAEMVIVARIFRSEGGDVSPEVPLDWGNSF